MRQTQRNPGSYGRNPGSYGRTRIRSWGSWVPIQYFLQQKEKEIGRKDETWSLGKKKMIEKYKYIF